MQCIQKKEEVQRLISESKPAFRDEKEEESPTEEAERSGQGLGRN